MVEVSARSYVAAGLAVAMAGAIVTNPLPSRQQDHPPAVRTAQVSLSALESALLQHQVALSVAEIERVNDAAREIAASVLSRAASTPDEPVLGAGRCQAGRQALDRHCV